MGIGTGGDLPAWSSPRRILTQGSLRLSPSTDVQEPASRAAAVMLPLCRCSFLTAYLPTRLPSILLLGVLYVVYVLTGGAVFWKLEGAPMEEELRKIRMDVARLRRDMPCLNEETIMVVAQVRGSQSGGYGC